MECKETDEDVMRVFVRGDAGAPGDDQRRICEIARQRRRPGAASARQRADARRRVRARGRRRMSRDSRSELPPLQGAAPAARPIVGGHRPRRDPQHCWRARRFWPCCSSPGFRSSSRTIQIYVVTAYAQASQVLPVDAQMFMQFVEQQGVLHFSRHGLRRRRADRQRSPRQRAADLSLEAAAAHGIHRRQAGDPDDVPAVRHARCRRCC